MTRPLVIDAFPFHDELDILEMRLTELYDAVDWFVIVEANVTHQDRPKPSHFRDNLSRFDQFSDKIISVWAENLPTATVDPDPWAREVAQREFISDGLNQIGVHDHDIVLQSDVDEIPRALHARNVRPEGFEAFSQRGHFWAVDWLYPMVWRGTVAGTVKALSKLGRTPFGDMRTMRGSAPCPPHLADAGWHFSWLGGPERATKKVDSFCHPEVEDRIRGAIDNDNFYWRKGFHVDGLKMTPVDVNDEWPQWIIDGHAPTSWFRPR